MFLATLNMFLLPAVTYSAKDISPCSDWCVCFFFCFDNVYHGLKNIHVGLRVYAAFHDIFHILELNIYLFLVSRNTRSMSLKSIITDASLTLGFRWSSFCARWLLKGAFIQLFNNWNVDVSQIFHHASVEMYGIYHIIGVWIFSWMFFYSFGAREINNAPGIHSDCHCLCYSLHSHQFIPYVASYGQFCSL